MNGTVPSSPVDTSMDIYHVKRGRQTPFQSQKRSPELRPFIAWDGEGCNLDGEYNPQSYVLFGCSTGDYISARKQLHTFDLLNFICDIGELYPDAFHIGFAFGYDGNMILRSLNRASLMVLHRTGMLKLKRKDVGITYYVKFAKGKWFSVSRVNEETKKRTTVRIDDMFSFFATKFTTAYRQYFGKDVPTVVTEGKQQRGALPIEEFDKILEYWKIEIQCMQELAEKLREVIYGADLRITKWHGPGSLASFVMKRTNIQDHMRVNEDAIREAARYGYAGGRFELFRCGRFEGPIYSYDINSAYPAGIAQLPSMVDGEWVYESSPDRIARFGIYHIRYLKKPGFSIRPGPLFHRDIRGEISFPHFVEGWYWSPEAHIAKKLGGEIVEGWHYLGSKERPFAWVPEMYQTRKEWKKAGNQAQLALKLTLNSLYGKMAQRVGYDKKKKRLPPFHQLEWAGWVTSNTRAMLFSVLNRIPSDALIAVETDGLYTSISPEQLSIANSADLGGWEISRYDELLYVQSGLAWLKHPADCRCCEECKATDEPVWKDKRRGLDAETFTLDATREYIKSLAPNETWKPYVGKTKRFVGLGAALQSSVPMSIAHCRWVTSEREIKVGQRGKRIHVPPYCDACTKGLSAWEMPHTLVVTPISAKNPMSAPHYIPWEKGGQEEEWSKRQREESELLRDDY